METFYSSICIRTLLVFEFLISFLNVCIFTDYAQLLLLLLLLLIFLFIFIFITIIAFNSAALILTSYSLKYLSLCNQI